MLGSINASVVIGKIKGIDIRDYGSNNAGFTNAVRILGFSYAVLVLLCDAFKTVIAIILAKNILPNNILSTYLSGIGTVLGHNFPIYFNFKGGKGVVVSIVSMLFANWLIGIVVIIFSASIMFFTRYISLGSIIGCMIVIIISFVFKWGDWNYMMFALSLSSLALYMHRGNIKRLIARTEKKINIK
jgi:glycerol-3-phosphate acyltransferase PlsY